MNRRTFLRCLPAAPIAATTAPTIAAQAALVEPDVPSIDDDDEREVLETCESCSKPLFAGDLVFSFEDGPTYCEAHAPTWNDLKTMQDEMVADGSAFEDHFEEVEHAQDARNLVIGRIVDGQGDSKYVWPL